MFSFKHFAVALLLSVIGVAYSYADNDWNLPTFDKVTPDVADGSTIRSFTSLEISLSRDGFNAPVGILKDKGSVTASFVAADGTKTTPSVTPSVKSGKLVLKSLVPVAKQGELEIKIPAGLVNNLAMPVATMTPEEIIAEGGCTNGEITLHYTISPVAIKCVRVTNARPVGEPQFVYDADGKLQKDRYGNYAMSYQWRDMINGKLIPDYDYISYIYFWFEEDFETIIGQEGASIKNLSNGLNLGVAALEFKTGNSGDGHKYDIIQFRISSEDWLKTGDHQGLYEVTLPAGIARTKDGMLNEAFTFQFTYGDPSQAKQPENIDLDKFVGKYRQTTEDGEIVEKLEKFDFIKEGDTYYVANPNGVDIKVPVKSLGSNKFELPLTQTSDYLFASSRGTSVECLFQEQGGNQYIYIDQYVLQNLKDASYQLYGVLYYQKIQANQPLPTYDKVTPAVADSATIRSFTSLEIELSRSGYDAPLGILKDKGTVTATFTAADGTKTSPAITPSVKNGKLVLKSLVPVSQKGELDITVPAGIVNNLAMPVATMTNEEIISEGGCTNDEITLHYTISPVQIKCVRVTNARPVGEPQFVYDEDGKLMKDRYGNYAISYEWRDMIDAELIPDSDYVSYIYFWFEEDFAKINTTQGAKLVNLSNGKQLGVAALEFKNGNSGDGHKYDIIQFRISSEDWLKNESHQGLYEVTLPAGIAVTEDGMYNEGITFQFTYGDPSQAGKEIKVDLDQFVGKYNQMVEEGEIVDFNESFEIVKEGDSYYVTNLNGKDLKIAISENAGKFSLPVTQGKDYLFCSMRGTAVEMLFAQNDGKQYVYIDQYIIQDLKTAAYNVYGVNYYQKAAGDGIRDINVTSSTRNVMYNLAGQRINAGKGIVIMNGKKMMVK